MLSSSYLIRRRDILGFVLFVFVLAGCSANSPRTANAGDPDRPLVVPEAAASRPKIVALGDSLTAGFGLAETESYPFLLQQRLNAEGYNYEVINAGVSGDTTLGGFERAEWVLEQENIEILILALGANDLLRGMPVPQMKKNLGGIIEMAQKRGIKVILCGMIAPPSMGIEYSNAYRNAFADLADEYDTAFVPFLLDNVALKRELNQADGIHPNAEGTRIMTDNIYAELRPFLERQ
jgi:acyl-CoA thioesterase I